MDVNLAIIYYSSTGTNYQMVKWAEEAATEAGANVKIVKVPELAPIEVVANNEAWKAHAEATKDIPEATSDDIIWADAIIFSSPTRFGVMASQMKQFLDTQGGLWAKGETVNKVVSAMASAQNPNGGQEATIFSIYTVMMHWGAIIVPPGYTDESVPPSGGNPYGITVTVDQNGVIKEDAESAVKHQAKRTVEIANKIVNN